MKQTIITGCPRSGTTWSARVLANAGLVTTHETSFDWGRDRYRLTASEEWVAGKVQVECSFKLAPMVREVGVDVVHLVRAPLDVITSMYALGVMEDPMGDAWRDWVVDRPKYRQTPLFTYCRNHVPEIMRSPPGLNRIGMFWVLWNRLCEQPGVRRVPLSFADDDYQEIFGVEVDPIAEKGSSFRKGQIRQAVTLNQFLPSTLHAIVQTAARYQIPLSMEHDPITGHF